MVPMYRHDPILRGDHQPRAAGPIPYVSDGVVVRRLGGGFAMEGPGSIGMRPLGVKGRHDDLTHLARLDGKVALVTGGSQGMGKEVARGLALRGARVIITSRNAARLNEAARELSSEPNVEPVTPLVADISSMSAVRRLVAEVSGRLSILDILVNNAGNHFQRRTETAEGIEETWAVNFLGPYLLTELLLEPLAAAERSRIVNVASDAMSKTLTFADLQPNVRFRPWRAYGEAKLALVMHTYQLAERLKSAGVTVNALHPGLTATSVADAATPEWLPKWVMTIVKPFLLTPEQGAKTALRVAASPELAGVTGRYFRNNREGRSTAISYDPTEQRRAMEVAKRLTGIGRGDANAMASG